MAFRAGPSNLISDVAGLRVGNAEDKRLKSGVTVVCCDEPAVAAVQVLGGAPGTRETDLLESHNSVQHVHAVALSGGSAFGLDAASGVQAELRARGIGFEVAGHRVPIVPAAIVFDLANGGDKEWGDYPPYRELGRQATRAASREFAIGSTGAGTGALVASLRGGLGSASTVLESGVTIGALVVANSIGAVTVGDTPHFWAAPFEIGDEFGGLGLPHPMPASATDLRWKFSRPGPAGANTTIAVVATDAVLTRPIARRMAISAHDGLGRAIWPAHTPADGDLVFALSTGASGIVPDDLAAMEIHAAAAATLSRAIARAVHAAEALPGDVMPVWRTRFSQ